MKSVLFLQSEEPDPYPIYEYMLQNHPVYRDEEKQITAVYTYADCFTLLNHPAAVIPRQHNEELNEHALAIAGKLARFQNPPDHVAARQVATAVFEYLKPAPIAQITGHLLDPDRESPIDWVEQVSKKVPVLSILKGFGFDDAACDFFSANIGRLVKIIQPNKTPKQISAINVVAAGAYEIVKTHILNSALLSHMLNNLIDETGCDRDAVLSLCISNLIGLMMQSYDACHGLLSNALLYVLKYKTDCNQYINDRLKLESFIVEILRFDPPVQNTRRSAAEDIQLSSHKIEKGEMILLVLAAANRDEAQFTNAGLFDSARSNNAAHLTFGAGRHACLANDYAVRLAGDTLFYLFEQYPGVQLLSEAINYEPIINGRLPENITISLT